MRTRLLTVLLMILPMAQALSAQNALDIIHSWTPVDLDMNANLNGVSETGELCKVNFIKSYTTPRTNRLDGFALHIDSINSNIYFTLDQNDFSNHHYIINMTNNDSAHVGVKMQRILTEYPETTTISTLDLYRIKSNVIRFISTLNIKDEIYLRGDCTVQISNLACGEETTAPTQASSSCDDINLRQVSKGSRCTTTQGTVFELVKRRSNCHESWRDLQTGIIWGNIVDQSVPFIQALSSCYPHSNSKIQWQLPTLVQSSAATQNGLIEVIYPPVYQNWTSSLVNGDYRLAYVFDGLEIPMQERRSVTCAGVAQYTHAGSLFK